MLILTVSAGVHLYTRACLFALPFLMARAWVVLFANREAHPGTASISSLSLSPLMNIARATPSPVWTAHFRLVSTWKNSAARWWIAALQKEFQTLCEYIYSTSAVQLAHLKGEKRVLKSLPFLRAAGVRYICTRALLFQRLSALAVRRRRCKSEMINYSSLIIHHWRLSLLRSDSSNEALVMTWHPHDAFE